MAHNFERPATIERAILKTLRHKIATRALVPGSVVLQDALAEQLGVSKIPLREALKLLEGEGLVVHRPNRGYEVAKLDLNDLVVIYRMRELLEAEAVRAAMPKLTRDDIEAMRTAMLEIENAGGDIDRIIEANNRFHLILVEAAKMPQLLRIIQMLFASSAPYSLLYITDPKSLKFVFAEHRRIFAAVEKRDPEQVIAALNAHRSVDRLNAALASEKQGAA